jgi:beta-1,4-glucosyltransferase
MMQLSNIPVLNISREELKSKILERENSKLKSILLFANTNFIVKSQAFSERLQASDILIVNDGIGVDIAAKLLYGGQFKDNLNGTDFTPFFFQGQRKKVFLLGSTLPDLEKAAWHLRNDLGQEVVGAYDGFSDIKDPNLINKINASGAEVLLVGMGNPLQEQWILDHYTQIDANVFMGVGALFVFMAGNKPRAPEWVRTLRMEWLFRMLLEPKRLVKRYTIDIVYFLYLCFKNKKPVIAKEKV